MKRRFLPTFADVAEAVRSGRDEAGMSQIQLAQKAQVDQSFIIDLEAGHATRELAKVLSVLAALGIYAVALPPPPLDRTQDEIDLAEVVARYA